MTTIAEKIRKTLETGDYTYTKGDGSLVDLLHQSLDETAAQAAEIERLRDKIENAQQAASETHGTWEARCYAILTALELDYGQDKKTDAFRDALGEQVADIERLKGALKGAVNWLDALLELVEETSCDPDDPKRFDEVVAGATLFGSAARAALSEREP